MNTEDRLRAASFGRQLTERMLALEPLSRLRVEAETDPRGHIRAVLRIEVTRVLTVEARREGE